jgi:mono/diheme cytochrome c family protein
MVRIGACSLGTTLLIFALLSGGVSPASAQAAKPTSRPAPERGKSLFARDCAFCHGRDAAGGESGPDLTRSRLVARDVRGDRIRAVVHDGRIERGMPAFARLTVPQVNDVIAFIRDQSRKLNSKPGGRRGHKWPAGKSAFGNNLGGGTRGCRSQIGHEIADGKVNLMAYGRDHGQAGFINGARHFFLIEGP